MKKEIEEELLALLDDIYLLEVAFGNNRPEIINRLIQDNAFIQSHQKLKDVFEELYASAKSYGYRGATIDWWRTKAGLTDEG